MCGQASALGGCVLVEDLAHLLGAVVGDFDTDVCLIRREGLTEAFLLTWGELVARGVQKKPDLVERIACASAVTRVSCWTRRRTSSRASPASLTM